MLLFFKDGKVVDQIIGAVPKKHIELKLQQHTAARQDSDKGVA
jgi:thioredoxin-like negative regulator of GroEL